MIAFGSALCLVAALAAQPSASSPREVRDDFDTNTGWAVGDYSTFVITMENGEIHIDGKPGNRAAVLLTGRMPVSDAEDYKVEAAVRHVSNARDEAFGIVFGASDFENRNAFLITDDGRYSAGVFRGGYTNLTGWIASPAVRQHNAVNVIAVHKTEGKFRLLINGTEVDRIPARPVLGASIGFEVDGRQRVAIEWVKVVQGPIGVASQSVERPVEQPKIEPNRVSPPDPGPTSSPGKQHMVVAVFDVEDMGKKMKAESARQLGELLGALLAKKGTYSIIPNETLRKQLSTQKADSYKACFDSACQIELGKAVAAEAIVTTKIIRVGTTCVITATLFDLKKETTVRAGTAETKCGEDQLLGGIKSVVEQL